MPASAGAQLDAQREAFAKLERDAYLADLDKRCHKLGVKLSEVEKALPDGRARIQRAMKAALEQFSPETLDRMFACRGCRVLYDDSYRATCAAAKVQTCFTKARLRGCPQLKPRIVISRHIPTAGRQAPQG
jgi:hypothetical protein